MTNADQNADQAAGQAQPSSSGAAEGEVGATGHCDGLEEGRHRVEESGTLVSDIQKCCQNI